MDAVRALPDVKTVAFDIPTETFTVDLADGGKARAVLEAIEGLGFEPRMLEAAPAPAAPPTRIGQPAAASLGAALERARAREVPLVVYAGGAFCPTCRTFERDVLSDGRVRQALGAFELLAIDIEKAPEAAADLGVVAVPDLWILSGDGAVLARENRTMDVAALLALLAEHAVR